MYGAVQRCSRCGEVSQLFPIQGNNSWPGHNIKKSLHTGR